METPSLRNLLVISLLVIISCNQKNEKNKQDLAIDYNSGIISVVDYSVKAGYATTGAVESGLKSMLQSLGKCIGTEIKAEENLKGSIVYNFRCEPDGMIRWFASSQASFTRGNNEEISNQLTGCLMKEKIRFEQIKDIIMIEAKIKFH